MSLEEEAIKQGRGAGREEAAPQAPFEVSVSRPAEMVLTVVSVLILGPLLVLSVLALYPPLGLVGGVLVAVGVALVVAWVARWGPRRLAARRGGMTPGAVGSETAPGDAPEWRLLEEQRRRERPPRQERLMEPDPREGPPLSEGDLGAALREGAALFDRGLFWEAHEAWESAWHRASEAERDFFRGLIHVAASLVHHRNGNEEGHNLQRGRAFRTLRQYGPAYRGVRVEDLLSDVVGLPPPGAPCTYPRIDLKQEEG